MEHADGAFYLAIGGSGGSRIFPSVFQVLLNLDWGFDIREAIEYGRLHNQLYPLEVLADDIYPENILDELRMRGHNITGSKPLLFCSSVMTYLLSVVSRVPAVVQAVLQKNSIIYGKTLLLWSLPSMLMIASQLQVILGRME